MTRVYNALLLNRIKHEIEKILTKNQNSFWKNHSTTLQIFTIHCIIEGVCAKNLKVTLLFIDFSKAFDSIQRGKMEQKLLAYGLSVTVTVMLFRNVKVKVFSLHRDTDFFDIVTGVL